MLFLAVVTVYQLITGSRRGEESKATFSDFMRDVEKDPGLIEHVRIDGQNYFVKYAQKNPPKDKATIIGPTDLAQGQVLQALDRSKIKYEIEKRDEGGWLTLLLGSWL